MQSLFIKKTFLVLVGLLLAISGIVYPGGIQPVDAEGGNHQIFLPQISRPNAVDIAAAENVLFGLNATWKYFDKGSLPASNWTVPGFDDSSWGSGSAPLGYGNGTERTVVGYGPNSQNKYITTYFRKVITIDNPGSITGLSMDLNRDDAAVVYLNGVEIFRTNMPTGAIGNTTLAKSCAEGTVTQNINPANLLLPGANTLAVEIHQCSVTSSDIAFSMVLRATTNGTVSPTSTPAAPVPTTIPTLAPTTPPTAAPTVAPTSAPTLPPTSGRSFYVSPSGSSSNSGSINSPWSLQYVLNGPSTIKAGDTIWVRGGTYKGAFVSKLKGASGAPITIRAYPRERATLSYASGPVLDIAGSAYVNFWGLEITSSYSTRSTSRSESTYGIRVNQGTASHHVKFINMIVHDVQAQGIGWWQALTDSEIYGSLFYFNGTTQLDHGVYFHNVSTTKSFIDNIVSDNASHGFHGYAETAEKGLNYLYMEGNTFFNNGSVGYNTSKGAYGVYKRNILVGGLTSAKSPTITNNYTYYPGSSGTALNVGYNAGSSSAKITNNYLMGGDFVLGGTNSSLTMTGNTVYAPGGMSGFSKSSFTNNTWLSAKPTGVKVFVRPNRYETNRANITIYNWSKQGTVSIPASSLAGIALKPGDRYELHNAQNYYGDVITGTYDGSAINVPMTGRSVAQPVGLNFKPATTFPEFGAFVLIAGQ